MFKIFHNKKIKEGEETIQRTCMNDPGTWTTVGINCGSGGWDGRRRAKGEKLGQL